MRGSEAQFYCFFYGSHDIGPVMSFDLLQILIIVAKLKKKANFLSFTYGPYDMVPTSPIWYGRTQSHKNAKNYFLTNSYMKMHFGVSYVVILKYGEIRKKYSHIKTTRSRSGLKYRVLDLFRLINLSSWIHHWPRRSLCVFNLVIKIFESLN